jgi:two-component system chemotaxis sensor kinase CheA
MIEELQLFLEDMDEQMSIMENTLLDINEIPLEEVTKDMINNIFRAMHTMKGNAGLFGFNNVVEFAHVAESLLEEIRNDRILLTKELVELFLLINDHSKILIDVTIKDKKFNKEQEKEHNHLLEVLNDFLNDSEPKSILEVNEVQEDLNIIQKYKISINLKIDFFKSGMDMLSIIKYLEVLGNVIDVKVIDDEVPLLTEINPIDSYLSLIINYETQEPKSEIIDAFEFVQEDIELNLEKVEKYTPKEEPTVNEEDFNFRVLEKNNDKSIKKTIEPVFIAPKNISTSNFSLKVDSSKIDKLINQISEMVIVNAKISQHAISSQNSALEESVIDMSEILEEVRTGVMNIRMVQVADSFAKLRRIVVDSSKKTGKDISFEIVGGETELDKTVIEKISDPLVHMLRNSVDHGIELPNIRVENGKKEKGNITLKAYPDSGTIVIEITDDGAGINKKRLLEKAIEKGIINSSDILTDKEIFNLIFTPGFSTTEKVSDISGRGVGMDVVKRNIEDLRGVVDIDSKLGLGTTISIRLPLTLAIIDGFLIQSGNLKFIIPLDSIQECLELTLSSEDLNANGYITLRSNVLPIIDLCNHFNEEDINNRRKNIVVVKYGNYKVGLKVDELFGEFQTVIKPLGELFKNVSGISGGTLLGNGEIALILDIQKLIEYKITNKDDYNGN